MESLMNFFGRLHPAFVHLPIGILILSFLFELLSRSGKYRKLGAAVQPSLLLGTAFAILSLVSGLLLSREGGYDDSLLVAHRNSAIATVVLAIALYLLRRTHWVIRAEKSSGKPLRLFLFLPFIAVLTLTGHLGGSITHGEEFLTSAVSLDRVNPIDPALRIAPIANVKDALLYEDIIEPILEARCYSCHSTQKQKGDLRLDRPDYIVRGGEHGPVIETGNADSSALYQRLMLPLEHEDHMPPNEKPQPGSVEIDLIRLWINEGAPVSKPVRESRDPSRIEEFIALIKESSEATSWIPEAEVSQADSRAIESLSGAGVVVVPVAANSNFLRLSLMNSKAVSLTEMQRLADIRDQLIALRLSRSNVTNEHLAALGNLHRLTWLYLDHTNISDEGVAFLQDLKNLRYINLTGTRVTDRSLETLGALPRLEQVFVFETGVTPEGVQRLALQRPKLRIDTGHYVLPSLVTDTMVYRRKR